VHSYRSVTECHFLTITSKGQISKFFAEASALEADPPNLPEMVRLANRYGIEVAI
jgi:hypothetical protein